MKRVLFALSLSFLVTPSFAQQGQGEQSAAHVGLIFWNRSGLQHNTLHTVTGILNENAETLGYQLEVRFNGWNPIASGEAAYTHRQALRVLQTDAFVAAMEDGWRQDWRYQDAQGWNPLSILRHTHITSPFQDFTTTSHKFFDLSSHLWIMPAGGLADGLHWPFYWFLGDSETNVPYSVICEQYSGNQWQSRSFVGNQWDQDLFIWDPWSVQIGDGVEAHDRVEIPPAPSEGENYLTDETTGVGLGYWLLFRDGTGFHVVRLKFQKFVNNAWVIVETTESLAIPDGSNLAYFNPSSNSSSFTTGNPSPFSNSSYSRSNSSSLIPRRDLALLTPDSPYNSSNSSSLTTGIVGSLYTGTMPKFCSSTSARPKGR